MRTPGRRPTLPSGRALQHASPRLGGGARGLGGRGCRAGGRAGRGWRCRRLPPGRIGLDSSTSFRRGGWDEELLLPGNPGEARSPPLPRELWGHIGEEVHGDPPRWEDAKLCQKNFYFGEESVRKRPESRLWGGSLPRAAPPEVGPSEGETGAREVEERMGPAETVTHRSSPPFQPLSPLGNVNLFFICLEALGILSAFLQNSGWQAEEGQFALGESLT